MKSNICIIPLQLEEGWNQINIDLEDFTRKAYSTEFKEVVRIEINASCRIKRVYFCRLPLHMLKIPPEFKAFANVEEDGTGDRIVEKEEL